MKARRVIHAASVGAVGVAMGVATGSAGAAGSFAQRADQACAAAGAKVEHLSPNITVMVINQQVLIVSSLVGELKRITPPAADATAYKKFISETEAQIVDIRAALATARKKEQAKTTRELKKVQAAGRASNATARGLKLPACAKNYTSQGS